VQCAGGPTGGAGVVVCSRAVVVATTHSVAPSGEYEPAAQSVHHNCPLETE
jgi:hypothetical protein